MTAGRTAGGISLRAIPPNAITVLALCFGLTGVRFAVSAAQGDPKDWAWAIGCVVFAGVLDGIDGRLARLLNANSRFGAELDSLSDNVAFGVAPALILFLWSLQFAPRFGWIAALALAVACALRLARFNSLIDADDQPHKSAGFLTGVPAPVGAGLSFLPVYLWLVTGNPWFQTWQIVLPWAIFVALLMISNVATFSWGSLRLRRAWRLMALLGVGLFGAALVTQPWLTLLAISAIYVTLIPFSIVAYSRVKQRRATPA